MPRLRYLPAARRDLKNTIQYVTEASGSPAIARRFSRSIQRRCEQLAALPGTMGRLRPELLPDLRSTVHGSYVIFFRYADDAFEVVRIMEGHRDLQSQFTNNR